MYVSSLAGVPGMLAAHTPFAWDFAPLPAGTAGLINFAGSAVQGIYAHSRHVPGAWDFVRG